jgi:hypothetical protein
VSGRAFPGGLALRWRFAEGDTNAPRLAIELLQAMVPKLRRLVIFIGAARRKPTIRLEQAARDAGLRLRFEIGHGLEGIEKVLAAIARPREAAILLFDLPISDTIGPDSEQQMKTALASLAEITIRYRIATLYPDCFFVDADGSMVSFRGGRPPTTSARR